MDTSLDFEDLLSLLAAHDVQYLIIGGMAFTYHAKPRYTKDMDLWVMPSVTNVQQANRALEEFGSPQKLDEADPHEILQIGVPPNRVDILKKVDGVTFEAAWPRRICDRYGDVQANWMAQTDGFFGKFNHGKALPR